MRSLLRSLVSTEPRALSLVPWAAFVLVLLVDGWATDGPVTLLGLVPALPLGGIIWVAREVVAARRR